MAEQQTQGKAALLILFANYLFEFTVCRHNLSIFHKALQFERVEARKTGRHHPERSDIKNNWEKAIFFILGFSK